MFGVKQQQSSHAAECGESETQSVLVEVSQASQTSQVSQKVGRHSEDLVKLPPSLVSKWVELESEWRTTGKVGIGEAEKAYAQAANDNIVPKNNIDSQPTIPEHHALIEENPQNDKDQDTIEIDQTLDKKLLAAKQRKLQQQGGGNESTPGEGEESGKGEELGKDEEQENKGEGNNNEG
eukprot:TRINITY_DN1462_c0_g1_i2.p2 TRINITY_DN1462_c0_g1~~TRINITY_DN1462_c0_g1_i2.p2  ORF type:complete len:179 (+),score=40.79 TRINITY_DN1462_c0_g1_i2:104-640(+)